MIGIDRCTVHGIGVAAVATEGDREATGAPGVQPAVADRHHLGACAGFRILVCGDGDRLLFALSADLSSEWQPYLPRRWVWLVRKPSDVYVDGLAVETPVWQGKAKATKEKLGQMVGGDHFPPFGPANPMEKVA